MSKYTAKELSEWGCARDVGNGVWVPARPINHEFDSWRFRLKCVWMVLIGKWDVLDWEE